MASCLRAVSPHILIVPHQHPSADRRKPAVLRPAPRAGGRWRAMVQQQQQTYQGSAGVYAKEMERLSAKESLLLAVRIFVALPILKLAFFFFFFFSS